MAWLNVLSGLGTTHPFTSGLPQEAPTYRDNHPKHHQPPVYRAHRYKVTLCRLQSAHLTLLILVL